MLRVTYINFNYFKILKNDYQKNTLQSIFLIFVYIIILILILPTFEDHGVHIEEKFHRLNGLYWLNYVSKVFNLESLSIITENKISQIYDYTLNKAGSYMDKYGVILDLPAALVEIFFNLEKINNIYYIKQLMSFGIFLTSSFFSSKYLIIDLKIFLSLTGMLLFVTSPRIFGDSFL